MKISSDISPVDGTFTKSELTKLLNDLRTYCDKGALDFDTPGALGKEDYFRLTGVLAADFNKLFAKVKNCIRSTTVRSARTSLVICLMKLRTDLSHTILSTLFRIPRRAIGKAIDSAREALVFAKETGEEVLRNIERDFLIVWCLIEKHFPLLKGGLEKREDFQIILQNVPSKLGYKKKKMF
ncbi:unnamed protein product [Psylliodes chrysocephalus]|uniref:Uncharacterized protein n=1 Tax=Psylliodes chrysocephalus TaxID=3402493 RepID=A0A9P0CYP0_9CUCU|nr:unnamed protein product [Psylliodes chrysocephala]